jgi:hypothetical protein
MDSKCTMLMPIKKAKRLARDKSDLIIEDTVGVE